MRTSAYNYAFTPVVRSLFGLDGGPPYRGKPIVDDDDDVRSRTNVLPRLRTRVVRELRRETWFVVNESGDQLATIPIELDADRSVRRVEVNGEVAIFTAGRDLLLVRPKRPLRANAGTIVMVHFR